MNSILNILKIKPTALIYDINKINNISNVILIDSSTKDYMEVYNSVNNNTFAIIYSLTTNPQELVELLSKYFSSISRIGLFFSSIVAMTKTTTNCDLLKFIINLVKRLQVKNIDFLACNTLKDPNWVSYYNLLCQQTGVIVGASANETGNIKYGGDWIMESTGQDIEKVYFNHSIMYYKYLLDNMQWSVLTNTPGYIIPWTMDVKDNYMYVSSLSKNNSGSYILQLNINDGSIVDPSFVFIPTDFITKIIIYGNYIYASVLSNGSIYKINMLDKSINTTWVVGLNQPTGMIISNNHMYVSNTSNGNISKINLTDGSIININWCNTNSTILGLAISNNYMYATDINNNNIIQINLADGTINNMTWSTGLAQPMGIAINGNDMYVSNIGLNNSDYSISIININDGSNRIWNTNVFAPTGLLVYQNNLYVCNLIGYIGQFQIGSPCFKENTKILCYVNNIEQYINIQDITKGMLVKTLNNNYIPVDNIKSSTIYNPSNNTRIKNRLYKYKCNNFDDLIITGMHSVVVDNITEELVDTMCNDILENINDNNIKDNIINHSNSIKSNIGKTNNKFLLYSYLDNIAETYNMEGNHTIWNFSLENENIYGNYIVYANGKMVESCTNVAMNNYF